MLFGFQVEDGLPKGCLRLRLSHVLWSLKKGLLRLVPRLTISFLPLFLFLTFLPACLPVERVCAAKEPSDESDFG